ncbi:MAG: hypothetical protein EOP66_02285 [Sphingomonas sp.]|nr:MAG: hypothetical protein EOP66_02285 [Sphingomonas sp.]
MLGVVTTNPFASVPEQVVVPFVMVGSGAHCAEAEEAATLKAKMLVPAINVARPSDKARLEPNIKSPP